MESGSHRTYFEIRPSPGKGLGVLATKCIPARTLVFSESPIFIIKRRSNSITEDDIATAYNKLTAAEKRTCDNMGDPRLDIESKAASSLNARVLAMSARLARFQANKFVLDRNMSSWGCFPVSSRFNHFCLPNATAIAQNSNGLKHWRIFKDVAPGEELTFTYMEACQYMTFEERQSYLKYIGLISGYSCQLCSLPEDKRVASDMRRCLMRHLLYMYTGKDLDGAPSTINGTALQKVNLRTQNLRAVGTVHAFLFGKLAEAEGLVAGIWPHQSYINAANMILIRAHLRGPQYLPKSAVSNVQLWAQKAKEMFETYTGMQLELMGGDRENVIEMVKSIGLNGRLPMDDLS